MKKIKVYSTKYILRFNLKRQNAIPPKILDKQEKHLFVRAKKYIYIYIYIYNTLKNEKEKRMHKFSWLNDLILTLVLVGYHSKLKHIY